MELNELIEIMAALRSEKGCPWDKKQTAETLKPYIIEEAYEVLDAVDEGNPEAVKEELGDLLFQIVFQCQLAKEKGDFTMAEVIEGIGRKMIRRHPHVFGDSVCNTAEDVVARWEDHKKKEGKLRESILDGVPGSLPSLLRAHRLQARASRAGFDWEKTEEVLKKLDEEMGEFRKALSAGDREEIEDELGDILFSLVNVSRFIEVDPEEALRKAIAKFIGRFRAIETAAAHADKELSDMTMEEMDLQWEEAKRRGL